MKKWFCILLAFLFMSGCGGPQPVMETVTDDMAQTVSYQPEYEILIYIPQDVTVLSEDAAGTWEVYLHKDGDYRIETKTLFADTAQSAIRQITGLNAEELTVLETKRFDLPEYRFVWFSEGSNHRADLVQDGEQFYCVIFSTAEAVGNSCKEIMTQVFASFGISAADDNSSAL